MNKKELLYYLLENNTNISIEEVVIGILLSAILAFFIYFVYKKTYSGVMYSKNFNVTLLMVTVVTTMVMLIIGSNLALSLGMVGALSIIRFRTAVKDTKDSAYIFWAIAVGIACGSGIYSIALFGSFVIAIILFFMNRGVMDETRYLVIVHGNESVSVEGITAVVNRHCKRTNLKMKNMTASNVDVTYEVSFGKEGDGALAKEIKDMAGVMSVNIVTYSGEIAG